MTCYQVQQRYRRGQAQGRDKILACMIKQTQAQGTGDRVEGGKTALPLILLVPLTFSVLKQMAPLLRLYNYARIVYKYTVIAVEVLIFTGL